VLEIDYMLSRPGKRPGNVPEEAMGGNAEVDLLFSRIFWCLYKIVCKAGVETICVGRGVEEGG
jgi:hypothetical protein